MLFQQAICYRSFRWVNILHAWTVIPWTYWLRIQNTYSIHLFIQAWRLATHHKQVVSYTSGPLCSTISYIIKQLWICLHWRLLIHNFKEIYLVAFLSHTRSEPHAQKQNCCFSKLFGYYSCVTIPYLYRFKECSACKKFLLGGSKVYSSS